MTERRSTWDKMGTEPVGRLGQSGSKTVAYFEEQVNLVIDWSIPNFSSLKAQMTPLSSDKVTVGTGSWCLRLSPIVNEFRKKPVENSAAVYLFYDFSTDDPREIEVMYKTSELGQKYTATQNGWGRILFQHSDVWGPEPKVTLADDTLKLRATVKYLPPIQTVLDRSRSRESLQKKLRGMYGSEVGKDFALISSEGTTRQVHRAVLSIGSPFFRALFQSPLNDHKTAQCSYTMEDTTTETMDALVRFMYYDCTKDLRKIARDVLVAADKYLIDDLKETCEHILVTELTHESAADLLLLADKVSASVLKDAALHHVAVNLPAMESSNHINKVFDDGNKRLSQEVISAVVRWGYKKV